MIDFSALYREQALPLAAYFLRRTRDPQVAADLVAETFAAALAGAARFDPDRGSPVGWLYGIARHQLAAFERRHRVEDRARRKLALERLELTATAAERLVAAAEREATARALDEALAELPGDQRTAVVARVVDEQAYAEIAAAAGATEPAVRQRVSRSVGCLTLAELRSGTVALGRPGPEPLRLLFAFTPPGVVSATFTVAGRPYRADGYDGLVLSDAPVRDGQRVSYTTETGRTRRVALYEASGRERLAAPLKAKLEANGFPVVQVKTGVGPASTVTGDGKLKPLPFNPHTEIIGRQSADQPAVGELRELLELPPPEFERAAGQGDFQTAPDAQLPIRTGTDLTLP